MYARTSFLPLLSTALCVHVRHGMVRYDAITDVLQLLSLARGRIPARILPFNAVRPAYADVLHVHFLEGRRLALVWSVRLWASQKGGWCQALQVRGGHRPCQPCTNEFFISNAIPPVLGVLRTLLKCNGFR